MTDLIQINFRRSPPTQARRLSFRSVSRYLVPILMISASPVLIFCGIGTPLAHAEDIPAAARQAGYLNHTFSSSLFSEETVDINRTYSKGYKWYLTNYFGGSNPTSKDAIKLSNDGSMLVYEPNDLSSNNVGTIASAKNERGYVGTAFGCGAFISAELSFDDTKIPVDQISGVPNRGIPAWWAMSAEHLLLLPTQHWDGQPDAFDHFIETDIFEFNRDQRRYPSSYAATIRDWFGIYKTTCAPNAYCASDTDFLASTVAIGTPVDWTIPHRFSMLWVSATSTRAGRITYFFDDVPRSSFSWERYDAQFDKPPVKGSTPWRFGVIDKQHLGLILGSASVPLHVYSVDVWQGHDACNIHN